MGSRLPRRILRVHADHRSLPGIGRSLYPENTEDFLGAHGVEVGVHAHVCRGVDLVVPCRRSAAKRAGAGAWDAGAWGATAPCAADAAGIVAGAATAAACSAAVVAASAAASSAASLAAVRSQAFSAVGHRDVFHPVLDVSAGRVFGHFAIEATDLKKARGSLLVHSDIVRLRRETVAGDRGLRLVS